jgi:hypothetical protein
MHPVSTLAQAVRQASQGHCNSVHIGREGIRHNIDFHDGLDGMNVSNVSQQDLPSTGATVLWGNFVTICGTMISKIKTPPGRAGRGFRC